MKDAHLSLETLARWLAGDLSHEDLMREVVAHLMARCPTCQRRYDEVQRLQRELEHWDERVAVFEGQEAPELYERLASLPFDEQVALVRDDESLHTWGLCQLLLKRSAEAAFDDPARAVNLAELAVLVARDLDEAYDPHWVLDLRAKACAYLGNARRVLCELRSAESAFREADALLGKSMTGNLEIEAEVASLKSSLRKDQRRFAEAVALLDRAIALYGELEDSPRVGRALIGKAKVLEESGDLEGAIELLPGALDRVDSEKDSRLAVYGRYNLIVCLILAGRYGEAVQLLPAVRELFGRIARPLDLVRLRWAEANVAAGLGDPGRAELAFRAVQREFLDHAMSFDAALVSLDLAALYAQQGRTQELKELAVEVRSIFASHDVQREAMAALILFQQAAQEERLTVRLARHLAASLERARPRRA
ncbi:MAG TPA: hypothetical protein VOA87_01370 [Thermoanaerobaculia bacterium]|nr:hypothetical protein [Thermoanaerobaculia bacterium]